MDSACRDFDAIVIGSGLCGMVAAASLAKLGKRILLLEQHVIPGGYATSFKRKGFTFEVSLHQTSGLGEGQILYRLLSMLGVMERIEAIRLAEAFAIHTKFGELRLNQDYFSQLRTALPGEGKGLRSLERLIGHIWKESRRIMGLSFLPRRAYDVVAMLVAPHIHRYRKMSLDECLNGFFSDAQLKNLVGIQWQYYGLPIQEISAVLYMLAFGAFLKEGFYYIKGSSQSLSNALIAQLKLFGGTALFNHRATKILIENGRVAGVLAERLAGKDGGDSIRYNARIVISNSDPTATFESLLSGQEAPAPSEYSDRMKNLDLSTSAVCAYIGLDRLFSDFSRDNSHSVISLMNAENCDSGAAFEKIRSGANSGYDMLTDYSSIDPSLAAPGKSTLVAFRSEMSDSWQGLTAEEYGARKRKVRIEMESQLEDRYPGICGHIEHFELSTPCTMERFTGNRGGAFNGFAYSPKRVGAGKGGVGPETPVKGLFLSSAWVGSASGGFYGSIIAGYSTAIHICMKQKWFSGLGKILFPIP
jgi:all-trans-retinol 13,14-reductase